MSVANRTTLAEWLYQIGESQRWLAEQLDCTSYQAVQHWVSGRRKMPLEHVETVRTLMITTGHRDLALGEPRLNSDATGKRFEWGYGKRIHIQATL